MIKSRPVKDAPQDSKEIVLRPHQEEPYERMLKLDGKIAGLADMRSGKTVLALKYIHDNNLNAFIFVPGWVANVWHKHVREKGFPFDDYEFYMFNKGRLVDRANSVKRLCVPGKKWIAVFNNEAMWQDPLDEEIVRAAVKSHAFTAIDEAHSIARRTSRQSKFAGRLGRRVLAGTLPLTGTPTSKGLHDYWSIFRYANNHVFSSRYQDFENEYVVKGGYFNYCQPSGTLVTVPVYPLPLRRLIQTQQVPIESLNVGDLVVGFDRLTGKFIKRGRLVKATSSMKFAGNLIKVELSNGRVSRYTPEHRCFVSLGGLKDQYAVYLMRRGKQYRVGSSSIQGNVGHGNSMLGPSVRLSIEGGDDLWILSTYSTSRTAREHEHIVSGCFGIPEFRFNGKGADKVLFNRVWEAIGDNEENAIKCLNAFGRRLEFPLITRQYGQRPLRSLVTQACNLMNGMYMQPYTGDKSWLATERLPITITTEPYEGLVYSLDIEDGFYVADGIATHNSIKGYQNTDKLKKLIGDHSFQITRQQAGTLDPEDVPIDVDLGAKAREYYKQFEEEAYIKISGFREDGSRERRVLLAKRKITEMLRLQQLASGIVGTPKTGYVYVDSAKLKAVVGIADSYLDQHRKPVIICRFLPEIWRVCEYFKIPLHRTFSGYAGESEKGLAQRTQNLKDFENGKLPVLVCQLHAIARGQDLSMADCTIFHSAGAGLRTFQQASARDLGDDYVPQHYHVRANNTIDFLIYDSFERDQETAALVSNLSYTRKTFSLMH